jgi:hypothetical protein
LVFVHGSAFWQFFSLPALAQPFFVALELSAYSTVAQEAMKTAANNHIATFFIDNSLN